MTWNYTISGMSIAPPIFSDTGCSFTARSMDDDVISSIKATYVYAGADSQPISKFVVVYMPEPPIISVLPRNMSLAKHGYAMTVKPHAVTFAAAAGREITGLSIYNMQGKRIFAMSGNHREVTWSRANNPRGMYIFKMTMNNGAVVQRNFILK